MSSNYKQGGHVPTSVLCNRLDELADAVTKGRDAVSREFTMRVPAELDRDADLVLCEASVRLRIFESAINKIGLATLVGTELVDEKIAEAIELINTHEQADDYTACRPQEGCQPDPARLPGEE